MSKWDWLILAGAAIGAVWLVTGGASQAFAMSGNASTSGLASETLQTLNPVPLVTSGLTAADQALEDWYQSVGGALRTGN